MFLIKAFLRNVKFLSFEGKMLYANSEEILELEKHDIGSKYLLGLHFQNYKF